jgi:palmitoyl-protein thioesterase
MVGMFNMMKTILKQITLISLCFNKTIIAKPAPSIEESLTSTFTTTSTTTVNSMPLVVLHGLESSSIKMEPFCKWLSESFNLQVFNIEIGNGEETSVITSLNKQLDELCETIYKIDKLQDGFNFIGMSQGGLLARGYVERCNLYPVNNLITLVTPHGGEFIKNIKINMYNSFTQRYFSVANYWRDPIQLESYLKGCLYLPILNNELDTDKSLDQKDKIKSLNNFVMIWSPYDVVLSPPESGKFSFFNANLQVIHLEETDLYNKDLLGLKYLNENDRLHMYQTNCSHVDHRNPECYSQLYPILSVYL